MVIEIEIILLIVSMLINIVGGIAVFFKNNQDTKDSKQDRETNQIKQKISEIEKDIYTELKAIVSTLSELKTTMFVGNEKTSEALNKIELNTNKISELEKEIGILKEKIITLTQNNE